ncbi:MAG: N-acetyl-gamma-glutamyl-phosphate reductase [Edaphocola sp.]
MIKAGIAGAAGYTGGELLRILLRHPDVHVAFAHSNSQAGKAVSTVHQDLLGDTDLQFASQWQLDIDVLFLCVGHGEAVQLLENLQVPDQVRIIDLSQDFRLPGKAIFGNRSFVYGLPELNKEAIKAAQNIANPGCFATALQLGLLPLAAGGFKGQVYTTGITGATGAGQGLAASSHFAWRTNNIQAYKSLTHQHLKEVGESLAQCGSDEDEIAINFVPWRGDFARGIFVSQQFSTEKSLEELNALYQQFYAPHPFTHVSKEPIHLKQVVHTNKCLVQIEQHEGQTVVHSVIDNLLKGASGQAVQNMNLMFGLDEKAGLALKAGYF